MCLEPLQLQQTHSQSTLTPLLHGGDSCSAPCRHASTRKGEAGLGGGKGGEGGGAAEPASCLGCAAAWEGANWIAPHCLQAHDLQGREKGKRLLVASGVQG